MIVVTLVVFEFDGETRVGESWAFAVLVVLPDALPLLSWWVGMRGESGFLFLSPHRFSLLLFCLVVLVFPLLRFCFLV